jgi:hypothetical protein
METILHLTDIHFGWEGDNPSGQADRKVCLDGLLNEVKKLEGSWRPTVICLTGDIAWRGSTSDYDEARTWLEGLLQVCGLTYAELVICPGNHDVIRPVARKLARPGSTKDADEVLEVPISVHFEEPFQQFISFCKSTGIPKLSFGEFEQYLVGARDIRNTRFVVLNTAWFSKDDDDHGKLLLGLPHLKYLEAHGQLAITDTTKCDHVTVVLFHHPAEWLHHDEQHVSGNRPNTLDYVADRSHLILTGHTHGEVRRADRIADRALHFTGGSAYAGASHFNSFRVIQFTKDHVTDRAFEFDPRSTQQHWKPRPAESRPLTHANVAVPVSIPVVQTFSTEEFRVVCRKDALRQLERKSRQLRQSGTLPATVERPVSVRVSTQRDEYDESGRLLRPEHSEQLMPLYDAVRQARLTLLLGDLGTGKSTLASQVIIETLDKSDKAVPVFVPSKALRLSGRFTHRELLTAINEYVNDEIWFGVPKFDVISLLEHHVEILIVFDGLDELPRDIAARLLQEAAPLVNNWSTIQVISTARPIELVGVSYAEWRIVNTVRLDESAKAEFIKNELVADGVILTELREKTLSLLDSLKEMVALDSIANSPLAIRLIYPRLAPTASNSSASLGDLLYDLLIERLDGWHRRDDKPSAYTLLGQFFPTAEQKAELVAKLAERAATGNRLGYDEARELLQKTAAAVAGAKSHEVAAEAISFFEWLGLIAKTEFIEFPLQPLAEVCAAAGLVARWQAGDLATLESELWRIVSFAGTIAKRRAVLEQLRAPVLSFIDCLLKDGRYVPAACYIVVETADRAIAEHTIQLIDDVEYRPLTVFPDERRASARNIAKTIVLAGDKGFDWYYAEYLDPRYPIPNAGAGVVTEVFVEWAALVQSTLNAEKKERLSKMIEPYKATSEGDFYGVLSILAILVPEAFSREDRFWYMSQTLGSPLFGKWTQEQFRLAKSDPELVAFLNGVLLNRSKDSLPAARLWCEWNPDIQLPSSIIQQAFRLVPTTTQDSIKMDFVHYCRERVGEERWLQFARWMVIADESTAGAAKVLFDSGERRISVLGDAVMRALHDGGYVAALEPVLSELVIDAGSEGVRWLAGRVANTDQWHGAYSGWWRVLLANIETLDDGPKFLAECARSLGPFTLPRYPEVREGFTRILRGKKGAEFRTTFRAKLTSLDPRARRGAARILVSSDPRGEAEALFVAVRSRANRHDYDQHEWEKFCLTLSFSPSALSVLQGKLSFLDSRGRALALMLLEKNGFAIDLSCQSELMKLLSTFGNWHLCSDSAGKALLSSESAFECMMAELKYPNSEIAQRIAERLLELHSDRLTEIEEAKCLVIRHGRSSWLWELSHLLRRMVREPRFADSLMKAADKVYGEQSCLNILNLLARAVTGQSPWKDVLWALLCGDARVGGRSESDQSGMALLEFGLEEKEHRKRIGEAAKVCLDDPRVQRNRWHEAYHWLGLIADEFSGLNIDEIQADHLSWRTDRLLGNHCSDRETGESARELFR